MNSRQPRCTNISLWLFFIASLLGPELARAHVSEQAFVLLLPTKIYIAAGVVAVVLTVLALATLPESRVHAFFSTARLATLSPLSAVRPVTSLLSFILFLLLLYFGVSGSYDPLKNPLSLFIWTVWWIGLVGLQGIVGNLWYWINPWSGPLALVRLTFTAGSESVTEDTSVHHTGDDRMGAWPAIFIFLLFTSFALADPVPGDPLRLSLIAAGYWLLSFFAILYFGDEQWLRRGEFITIIMRRFAQLAVVGRNADQLHVGLPGWQTVSQPAKSASEAIFILVMLGCGSFDGLNETFWWLVTIGINPLEFPGRSAIVIETVTGLVVVNILLVAGFALSVSAGLWLAGPARRWNARYRDPGGSASNPASVDFTRAFTQLAISLLPIAFAYHIAHFATAFMVNGQYSIAAISDPFASGANYLGIGHHFVSTGFLNSRDSVQLIWLSQAGVVVIGHMLSVVIAHRIAIDLFGGTRRAAISQLPLAAFMIGYTFLGLWLLAAPKGA